MTMPDERELRRMLSPDEYNITQEGGTEPAFSGEYYNLDKEGIYYCKVCNTALFLSDSKFNSGTGWPSFYKTIQPHLVIRREDKSHGMTREEIACATCGAHLGHAFENVPSDRQGSNTFTSERLCVNSASLVFYRKRKVILAC